MTPLIDGKSIDREVAESTVCENCGSPMGYKSRSGDPGSVLAGYHAWAVCTNPKCDNEFEF